MSAIIEGIMSAIMELVGMLVKVIAKVVEGCCMLVAKQGSKRVMGITKARATSNKSIGIAKNEAAIKARVRLFEKSPKFNRCG